MALTQVSSGLISSVANTQITGLITSGQIATVANTQVTGVMTTSQGGTGVTTSTGSGSNVLSTSPTLVTPILGTPTSVTLTNATGLPLTTGVTGTLPIANGGTNSTATPTAGAVPYGTGSAFAFTAAGTSGQVLTSAGSGAPTWSTPSAGAMTLISTQTVSSVSYAAFTGLSTYDRYILTYENATFTDNVQIWIEFGYGSTPTYVTSGYYDSGIYAGRGAAQINASVTYDGGTSGIIIGGSPTNVGSKNTNSVFSGNVQILNALGTRPQVLSRSTINDFTNTYMVTLVSTGSVSLGAAVTAMRIYMSAAGTSTPSSNITGTFSLYGISS